MSIKTKIYLDTSVISHLAAEDVPDKKMDTLKLWEQLKQGENEIIISSITTGEIDRCAADLRRKLLMFVAELETTNIDETEEMRTLAEQYLKYGVLTQKSLDDCRHIAAASVMGCKYILSWNFKHFVNVRTIERVQGVNRLVGYGDVNIIPPPMFLKGDAENE
ncbi:hypothetical protein FACS1894111_12180 [Clostridia bacterium]|nr:hypothetical protein FACS1894111_12180 [Clostridia bacterium]